MPALTLPPLSPDGKPADLPPQTGRRGPAADDGLTAGATRAVVAVSVGWSIAPERRTPASISFLPYSA